MRSMNAPLFREALYLLQRAWVGGDIQAVPVTGSDHYYTDGAACGACLKLLLPQSHQRHIVYLFPSGRLLPLTALDSDAAAAIKNWVALATTLFSPAVAAERVQGRTRSVKEELMAAAWHTRRVAAALEQGIEMEAM